MSNQDYISKYYPKGELFDRREKLVTNNSLVSKEVIRDLVNLANKKPNALNEQTRNFINYLSRFIRFGNNKNGLSGTELDEALDNHFQGKLTDQNTMWQLRFLKFISDANIRKQISSVANLDEKIKIANIQVSPHVDSKGEEWNTSTHNSFGRNPTNLEPSFHIVNNYPRSLITVERLNEDSSTIEDRELAKKIASLVQETFIPEKILATPNIKIDPKFFSNDKSKDLIIKQMNTFPISNVINEMIDSSSPDGQTFKDVCKREENLNLIQRKLDHESSLLNIYLERFYAKLSGDKIVPRYVDSDDHSRTLDYELGFNPKNYEGKEGLKRLSLEAYDYYKQEYLEKKEGMLDLIFNKRYQIQINFAKLNQELQNKLKDLGDTYKDAEFNLNLAINLGDQIALYALGDSTIIPILHGAEYNSSQLFQNLSKLQHQQKHTHRLYLGKKAKQIEGSFPAFYADVLDKRALEAVVFASKNAIKASKQASTINNDIYTDFFNASIKPYINDGRTVQRTKDAKLITEMLTHINESQNLNVIVLSHKIGDGSDSHSYGPKDWYIKPAPSPKEPQLV